MENAERAVERSPYLVGLGWITLYIFHMSQACLLATILTTHLGNPFFFFCFMSFTEWIPFALIRHFFRVNGRFYADNDETIRGVWIIWGTYIIAYVITVAVIFATVAHKLTNDDFLGINALIYTLCITPGLLILLLQLMICPSYQKPVLSLSIFAALNIFDGIEMLKIILMQKEGNYDIHKRTEICIVFFACLCFLFSPLSLSRNKFVANGEIKQRKRMSMILIPLEIIGINLSFLVLRLALWHKCAAPIFIAKNTIAIVTGGIQFFHLKEM